MPSATPEEAGLIEVYCDEQGREPYRLTADGARVARQLATFGGDSQDRLIAGLLGEAERWTSLEITQARRCALLDIVIVSFIRRAWTQPLSS